MNGSAFDQPLCGTANTDPTARPPEALPVELMAPSDLPNGAEAKAAQLLREGYLVIQGCLSASRVDDVKRLLDESAAKEATKEVEVNAWFRHNLSRHCIFRGAFIWNAPKPPLHVYVATHMCADRRSFITLILSRS